jgi:hypothetical protein
VTVPAGKLVDAIAAVREVAGSGVVTAAAPSVAALAGADGAALLLTGVRSLAGVAFADDAFEETWGGPSMPPRVGAGAEVEGFAAGVASGLLSAGAVGVGAAAGCDAGAAGVGVGCSEGCVDGEFEIKLCVNWRTSGT